MHFCYIDESGCTGTDLANHEQPIFICGGIIVRDEGWNTTQERFVSIINEYFENNIPENFELHSCDLLSPEGEGFFAGHSRERRNRLANNLLSLIGLRNHGIFLIGINKRKLAQFNPISIRRKEYLQLNTPYLISYDYIVSLLNWYVKSRLGSSARALIILDRKDAFRNQIENITYHRRFNVPNIQRVKRITEFSYPIDSHKNPMIQLSDLVCFAAKKFYEIDGGYRETYPIAAKDFFKSLYILIDDCLIRRELLLEEGRHSEDYNYFINSIIAAPRMRWRTTDYH